MNNKEALISKIERNEASWKDFSEFIKIQDEFVDPFFDIALEKKRKYFGDFLKVYIPNDRYPAISITGDYCELNCEHCNNKYLKGMKALTTNETLYDYLKNHAKGGGVGALISGGCLKDGSVPLVNFLDTIKKIKIETDLIINIHTGLLNELTAKKLVEAQVDIISFDINIDPEIIQNIYHLNKKPDDYKEAVKLFQRYNLNVIPHICVGLHYGNIRKELECIRFIKKIGLDPTLIVLIALIPPRNSKKTFKTPNAYDIAKIIALTRFVFPNKEISLGCMRPRGKIRENIERKAILAGITRIEMPSRKTLKWINNVFPEMKVKYYSACCAIPDTYEKKAQMKRNKLNKYLRI